MNNKWNIEILKSMHKKLTSKLAGVCCDCTIVTMPMIPLIQYNGFNFLQNSFDRYLSIHL